jgi:hypothetical protein
MRKSRAVALAGLGSAVLAGAAVAATPSTHVMNVPLADGSSARIEYVGDVAPRVTVEPGMRPVLFDPFAGLDMMRPMIDMRRQIDAMLREAGRLPARAVAPSINVAASGNLPAGSSSISMISTSNGERVCTRTTEVVSQGAGKPPRVTSRVSGDCAGAAAAPATSGPINHT